MVISSQSPDANTDATALRSLPTAKLVEFIEQGRGDSHSVGRELARRKACEIVPRLVQLINCDDAGVVAYAQQVLNHLPAAEVIPRLIQLLKHHDPRVVFNTAFAVHCLYATPAIPSLIELLEHKDARVIGAAAFVIGEFGVTKAIPRLIELLAHKDTRVIAGTVYALGKLQATEVIPRLIRFLTLNHASVVAFSVVALRELKATEAIPYLFKLLEHSDHRVIVYAAHAVGQLQATRAIPRLVQLLEHKDARVIASAVYALGKLHATAVIPRLFELLKHESAGVLAAVACALGDLHVTEAIPQLIELLDHDDVEVVEFTVAALGKLEALDAMDRCVIRLADTFNRTTDIYARTRLLSTMDALPTKYQDHIAFLGLALDPRKERRLALIHNAFELQTIQDILDSVLNERGRKRANGQQVRWAAESEFWLAAREDPLFCTPVERIVDDLFPNVRSRLSGAVCRIMDGEQTETCGKKKLNGEQKRRPQFTNYSDQFWNAESGGAIQNDSVAELYDFLEWAARKKLISARQVTLFDLLSCKGHTRESAAHYLGISKRAVDRNLYNLREILNGYYLNPAVG